MEPFTLFVSVSGRNYGRAGARFSRVRECLWEGAGGSLEATSAAARRPAALNPSVLEEREQFSGAPETARMSCFQ